MATEVERYDRDLLRAHDGAFVMYDDVAAVVEENARLRALLADAASELWERGMVRGDELLDKIDAELRKPDAAD